MDYLQFAAAVIESLVKLLSSLAWPAAVIAIVWILRERFSQILPFLKIKYSGAEVSFELDKAEKKAAELPVADAAKTPATPPIDDVFERMVKLSPRAAVLEKRTRLEIALRQALERLSKINKMMPILVPAQNLASLAKAFADSGYIDRETLALLNDLRVLGNKAAHMPEEWTGEEAHRYGALADQVIAVIDSIARDSGPPATPVP